MMRFEDLEVWKRSARLNSDIYKTMKSCNDYGFKDQLTRASLSIPSNIAEGFERASEKECIKFLSYSKGSCGELRTQIYIGIEVDYITADTEKRWIAEAKEISSMIAGLMKTKRNFLE